MKGRNKYLLFSGLCLESSRNARISLYSSRKSKHTYTQHQLIAVYALMRYTKPHYRDIVSLLELMPDVQKILGLSRIPHYTTIQKFIHRFGQERIDALISVQTSHIHESVLGIDASGFSSDYASKYYTLRIKGEYAVKHFVKDSLCIDVFSKLITSSVVCIGPRNDNKDFIPLLRKSLTHPAVVVADKGYDSEDNHRYVDSLHAVSMIPVKINVHRGKYRHKMQKRFSELVYHRRSLTETVFSVIKRVLGSVAYAKSDRTRVIEVCWMNYTYNLHRLVQMQVVVWMISTEPSLYTFRTNGLVNFI